MGKRVKRICCRHFGESERDIVNGKDNNNDDANASVDGNSNGTSNVAAYVDRDRNCSWSAGLLLETLLTLLRDPEHIYVCMHEHTVYVSICVVKFGV